MTAVEHAPEPVTQERPEPGPNYKWIALSNTTLGMLMATINSSIVLIALPDIFRGIGINPLEPGNTSYLLWMIMGFLVVTAVLVVGFGRLGDMFGRVRMYNLGFAVFTVASVLLVADLAAGRRGRAVADRLADRAGHRRRVPDGELVGDPDRRVPPGPARSGARHQRRRGDRRLVPRPGDRRPARPGRLEARLPRVGAVRPVRDRVGLPEAPRHRRAPPREDGLVGQHHVRGRPDRDPGRHHLRHPALRRLGDGLGEPDRAGLPDRRRARARGVRASSSAGSPTRCSRSRCSATAASRSATSRTCSARSAAAACSSC